jgi:hypothetical protein
MASYAYTDLIQRLTDLTRLTLPPSPGERTGCQSSRDRRSHYDAASGTYQAWDANDDGSGFIRRDGERIVVFDEDGPGVIWRVWSALPGAGWIRIWLDGADEPAVALPFRDFFERFGTDVPPLNLPELVPTLSRGRNRFIPIPYQRHCTITLDPEWGAYYHITYTRFPDGTGLPDLRHGLDRGAQIALAAADRALSQRGRRRRAAPGEQLVRRRCRLEAGTASEVWSHHGAGAVLSLRLRIDEPDPALRRRALRACTIALFWDGADTAAVWSPIGALFGAEPDFAPYRTLPLGMDEQEGYCHWVMPFATGARLVLGNDDARTVDVDLELVCGAPPGDPAELLRFHARWHRDAELDYTRDAGRAIDWPVLLADGPGRFVGMHLAVWNRWPEPTQPADEWWYGTWDRKSIDWWWGEGDEKFFVDGELMPSTFGTGTEDYIGFAWAAEPPFPTFDSAYAAMPWIELNANGHTSVDRFHVCDDIPFQQTFEASIEKYRAKHWADGAVCRYAVVAYWYQRSAMSSRYPPQSLAERLGWDA